MKGLARVIHYIHILITYAYQKEIDSQPDNGLWQKLNYGVFHQRLHPEDWKFRPMPGARSGTPAGDHNIIGNTVWLGRWLKEIYVQAE